MYIWLMGTPMGGWLLRGTDRDRGEGRGEGPHVGRGDPSGWRQAHQNRCAGEAVTGTQRAHIRPPLGSDRPILTVAPLIRRDEPIPAPAPGVLSCGPTYAR
ncbi:MAG: hypothetical protein Tsb0013_16550 [Phycisphaerales bacterium]